MRHALSLACAGLAVAACTMNEPAEADRGASEARTSAALADYEPSGPPVSCVSMRNLRGNHSAGDAIVFEGVGPDRIWVNRPAGGCPDLNLGRALRTMTTTTQLCRGDIATVFDPVSGIDYGSCGLGDFQPYRRRPR
ncbi:MAG: hypothetical protein JOZ90_12445 [Alphaproteobacteria bacterium]|nr:hypothetical protein [Alphaproteobacteria bacterium]MBV9372132.1 hypothetical protein [Alphaproteobacteria bacterium]MBV9901884.1 hypothetical protein [Alphaproteobacteria bacterium]